MSSGFNRFTGVPDAPAYGIRIEDAVDVVSKRLGGWTNEGGRG